MGTLYSENDEWQMCNDTQEALVAEFGLPHEPAIRLSDLVVDPAWGETKRASRAPRDAEDPNEVFADAHRKRVAQVHESMIEAGQRVVNTWVDDGHEAEEFFAEFNSRHENEPLPRIAKQSTIVRNRASARPVFSRPWRHVRRNSQNATASGFSVSC